MIGKAFGTTRVTLIVCNKYVFKVPTITSYKLFLLGILGNLQEKQFSNLSRKLCPVYFSFPFGLLNIMPYAKPLTREQYFNLDYQNFVYDSESNCQLPVEYKLDSFGIYSNRIVAVDYGSPL